MSNADSQATVDVLGQIISLLQKVDEGERQRIFQTVATFFDLGGRQAPSRPTVREATGSFSEDRDISPKEFLLEKKPATDVERIACLAYYLTHYRGTPHFKTLDLSKLNTEAAQVKFSNATVTADNAFKMGYLVAASKGQKQLSAVGEQFVRLLPDREAARTVMANARPRRRTRRSSTAAEK